MDITGTKKIIRCILFKKVSFIDINQLVLPNTYQIMHELNQNGIKVQTIE